MLVFDSQETIIHKITARFINPEFNIKCFVLYNGNLFGSFDFEWDS